MYGRQFLIMNSLTCFRVSCREQAFLVITWLGNYWSEMIRANKKKCLQSLMDILFCVYWSLDQWRWGQASLCLDWHWPAASLLDYHFRCREKLSGRETIAPKRIYFPHAEESVLKKKTFLLHFMIFFKWNSFISKIIVSFAFPMFTLR